MGTLCNFVQQSAMRYRCIFNNTNDLYSINVHLSIFIESRALMCIMNVAVFYSKRMAVLFLWMITRTGTITILQMIHT